MGPKLTRTYFQVGGEGGALCDAAFCDSLKVPNSHRARTAHMRGRNL